MDAAARRRHPARADRQRRRQARRHDPLDRAGRVGARVRRHARHLGAFRSGLRRPPRRLRQGRGRLPVRRVEGLDQIAGRPLPDGRRRHQPVHGRADRAPVPDLHAGLDEHQQAGQRLLRPHAGPRGRPDGHLPVGRPLPVLRLLGGDARPDVLPHRDVGLRAAHLRRPQVLHLHRRRLGAAAARDPVPGRPPGQGPRRPPDLRPTGTDGLEGPQPRHRPVAVPGLRGVVRHQGAAVPAPHMAARRPRRGADRGVGAPRRPPSGSSTARWWRRCSAT